MENHMFLEDLGWTNRAIYCSTEQFIDVANCIVDFKESPLKEDDKVMEAQDPLSEVDIDDEQYRQPIYVSALLDDDFQTKLVELSKKYK